MKQTMWVQVWTILMSIAMVRGHGFLQLPTSRNLDAYENKKDYNFMSLNAGGTGTVQSKTFGGLYLMPDPVANAEQRHGMCGDISEQVQKYNDDVNAYSILHSYEEGDTITIEVVLTAHHMGHFEFYLCNVDQLIYPTKGITQECLYQHPLVRAPDDGISPIDPNYPFRYYLEPTACMTYQTDGYPGYKATMKYTLPPGVVCDHCVLQWWYYTGNSCIYDGYHEFEGMKSPCTTPWYNSRLGNCKDPGTYPEEFWNCADIRIKKKARPGPSPSPSPSPGPGPSQNG